MNRNISHTGKKNIIFFLFSISITCMLSLDHSQASVLLLYWVYPLSRIKRNWDGIHFHSREHKLAKSKIWLKEAEWFEFLFLLNSANCLRSSYDCIQCWRNKYVLFFNAAQETMVKVDKIICLLFYPINAFYNQHILRNMAGKVRLIAWWAKSTDCLRPLLSNNVGSIWTRTLACPSYKKIYSLAHFMTSTIGTLYSPTGIKNPLQLRQFHNVTGWALILLLNSCSETEHYYDYYLYY